MTRDAAEREMLEGYLDGFARDAVTPGPNRSKSYRHGFANARDDVAGEPRASAALLREDAQKAIGKDIA